MSAIKEFTLSFVFIIGWFILIIGVIGFIISLFAKGMWILIPVSAILIGLFLIWFYKKFSH